MPYIAQARRSEAEGEPTNVGELNFAITRLLVKYIQEHGRLSYARINDCLGALAEAKKLVPTYNATRTVGEGSSKNDLKWAIAIAVTNFMRSQGSEDIMVDAVGAIDGASKEFYRRVAVPYEDRKIAENGDVYADLAA